MKTSSKSLFFIIILIGLISCQSFDKTTNIVGSYVCKVQTNRPVFAYFDEVQLDVTKIKNDSVVIDVESLNDITIAGLKAGFSREDSDYEYSTDFTKYFAVDQTEFSWGSVLSESELRYEKDSYNISSTREIVTNVFVLDLKLDLYINDTIIDCYLILSDTTSYEQDENVDSAP